MIQTSEKSYRN